jgi:hypothetical protein
LETVITNPFALVSLLQSNPAAPLAGTRNRSATGLAWLWGFSHFSSWCPRLHLWRSLYTWVYPGLQNSPLPDRRTKTAKQSAALIPPCGSARCRAAQPFGAEWKPSGPESSAASSGLGMSRLTTIGSCPLRTMTASTGSSLRAFIS